MMKKVSLIKLHKHLTTTHRNVNETNFKDRFEDKEYYIDSWYFSELRLDKLVITHSDIHQWFGIKQNALFVEEWQAIKAQLSPYQDRLVPKQSLESNDSIAIVARQDPNNLQLYRVWDGQLRVVSALWSEIKSIKAYTFIDK